MNSVDQVYSRLLRRIELSESGWREGDIIPTETELCSSERVSRMTLRGALKRLAVLGYLAQAPKKRRCVSRPTDIVPQSERQPIDKELGRLAKTLRARTSRSLEQLCAHSPALLEQIKPGQPTTTSWGEVLLVTGQQPTDIALRACNPVPLHRVASDAHLELGEVIQCLGADLNESVYWLSRVRCANDVPVALQTCIVRLRPWGARDLILTKDDLVPGGLTKRYREYGIQRDFATVSFQSHRATPEEARLLRVERDAPLIEEHRSSYMLRRTRSKEQLWPYEYLITFYTERLRLRSAWSEIDDTRPRLRGRSPAAGIA